MLDLGNAGSSIRVSLSDACNDVQPCNDSPDAILLTDMVATGTETFLATDGELVSVKECAEELPSSGNFVAIQTLSLGDEVDSTGGWHTTGKTMHTILSEVGDKLRMVSDNSQTVSWRDEGVGSIDHVTVTITVASSAEVDLILVDSFDQRVGIGQVRVGMTTAKIWRWLAVLGARAWESELFLEDSFTIWACNTVEGVKENAEGLVLLQELLDEIEIKDFLEHIDIISSGVDDFDFQITVCLASDCGDIDIRDIGDLVFGEGL